MLSFSLVFSLFCFCFVFVLFVFTEAAALRSIVLCSLICIRCPESHTQLPNISLLRAFSFLFLPFFVSLEIDVAFSEYFCTVTVFSL